MIFVEVKKWNVLQATVSFKSTELCKTRLFLGYDQWIADMFTSLAARSCCTTAELTVLGIVKVFSKITFKRSRTPW